jgi:hypothetical protein
MSYTAPSNLHNTLLATYRVISFQAFESILAANSEQLDTQQKAFPQHTY